MDNGDQDPRIVIDTFAAKIPTLREQAIAVGLFIEANKGMKDGGYYEVIFYLLSANIELRMLLRDINNLNEYEYTYLDKYLLLLMREVSVTLPILINRYKTFLRETNSRQLDNVAMGYKEYQKELNLARQQLNLATMNGKDLLDQLRHTVVAHHMDNEHELTNYIGWFWSSNFAASDKYAAPVETNLVALALRQTQLLSRLLNRIRDEKSVKFIEKYIAGLDDLTFSQGT